MAIPAMLLCMRETEINNARDNSNILYLYTLSFCGEIPVYNGIIWGVELYFLSVALFFTRIKPCLIQDRRPGMSIHIHTCVHLSQLRRRFGFSVSLCVPPMLNKMVDNKFSLPAVSSRQRLHQKLMKIVLRLSRKGQNAKMEERRGRKQIVKHCDLSGLWEN